MHGASLPPLGRRWAVARTAAAAMALAAGGCAPITIELLPKHYHGCESGQAPSTQPAGSGLGEDDALAPDYVAQQAHKLTEAWNDGE